MRKHFDDKWFDETHKKNERVEMARKETLRGVDIIKNQAIINHEKASAALMERW